jgi:tetratricopeptide (TPR) repeat protein
LDRLAKKDFSIGRLYLKMGDYEAARIYLQGVIDDYAESNYGAEALYLFARSLEKEKKFAEAKSKYEAGERRSSSLERSTMIWATPRLASNGPKKPSDSLSGRATGESSWQRCLYWAR